MPDAQGRPAVPVWADDPGGADAHRLRAALDAAQDAIVVTDAAGRVVEANRVAERVSGVPRERALGRLLLDLAREAGGDEEELSGIRAAVAGESLTYRARRPRRTVLVEATPLPGGGAVFVSQGIAAYRLEDWRVARARLLVAAGRALASPRSIDETLAALADLLVPEWGDSCFCALLEGDGAIRLAAARHEDPGFGEALAATLPRHRRDLPESGFLFRVLDQRRPILIDRQELRGMPEDLSRKAAALGLGTAALAPLIADDELIGVIGLAREAGSSLPIAEDGLEVVAALADRVAQGVHAARLQDDVRAAQLRFQAAFEHAPIGIVIVRPEGGGLRYVEANPAFSAITGFGRDEIVGRDYDTFTHPEDRAAERERLDSLRSARASAVTGEKRIVCANGEVRRVQVRSAPLDDGSYVTQVLDVTERHRIQTELEHLASHDTLTGLVNRRRLHDAVEEALANVLRHGDHAALLTLDIDNFKHVNDTHGHAAGDRVLCAVADVLRNRMRSTDVVGRFGGDEFGIVLPRTSPDAARSVADDLLDALRELRVQADGSPLRVTASIGLRALEPGERSGADELLSEADMAMYDAKESGRDRVSVIRPGDRAPDVARERARSLQRIRDALERPDGFQLYEQPIVRLSDGAADRSELLLRMAAGDGGLLAPGSFLPDAERYGQIRAIDRWVLRHAVALLAKRAAAGPVHAVEVNLSGDSISDPSVVDFIVDLVEDAGIDPRLLIFEVTETSAIHNLERARGLAERLSALGCGFALDDFGAGFGSFAYLKHLPFDVIKIDGQFIRGLRESHVDQVTVRAIVDIARALGKETVAERVEDAPTLELLRELGVDRVQGYFVGRPRPAESAT